MTHRLLLGVSFWLMDVLGGIIKGPKDFFVLISPVTWNPGCNVGTICTPIHQVLTSALKDTAD